MLDQIIEEGATFELNGVECQILSVGAHQVDGEPAGYSYSFRPVSDIAKDAGISEQAAAKVEETAEETTNESEGEQ